MERISFLLSLSSCCSWFISSETTGIILCFLFALLIRDWIWNNDTHFISLLNLYHHFCIILPHTIIFLFQFYFCWCFHLGVCFLISKCTFLRKITILNDFICILMSSKPSSKSSICVRIICLACWNGLVKSNRKSLQSADQRNTSTNCVIKSIYSR